MPKKTDIYSDDEDQFLMYLRLQGLTRNGKKAGFGVHDFTKATLGQGIVNEFSISTGIREFHVLSQKPISGGDMIITHNAAGKSIARLAFDVEQDRKQDNLYRVRTVKAKPEAGIGHILKMDK